MLSTRSSHVFTVYIAQIVLTGLFHGVYTLSSCSLYQRVPASRQARWCIRVLQFPHRVAICPLLAYTLFD